MAAEAEPSALDCGVCSRPYNNVLQKPRLLPCSHTLCWHCHFLLPKRHNKKQCPFCRDKHAEGNTTENPYVLAHMKEAAELTQRITQSQQEKVRLADRLNQEKLELARRITLCEQEKSELVDRMKKEKLEWEKQKEEEEELRKEKEEGAKFKDCEKHEREENLFCSEPECNMPICPVCLTRDHLGHQVVDLQEVQETLRSEVIADLEILADGVTQWMKIMSGVEERPSSRADCVVKKLETAKAKILQKFTKEFDKMISEMKAADVRNRRCFKDLEKYAHNQLADIASTVTDVENFTGSCYDELVGKMRDVESLKDKIMNHRVRHRTLSWRFGYCKGELGDEDLQRMCGTLCLKYEFTSQQNAAGNLLCDTSDQDRLELEMKEESGEEGDAPGEEDASDKEKDSGRVGDVSEQEEDAFNQAGDDPDQEGDAPDQEEDYSDQEKDTPDQELESRKRSLPDSDVSPTSCGGASKKSKM